MKGLLPLLTMIEVLILKPLLVSHEVYQEFVLEQLKKVYLQKLFIEIFIFAFPLL